MMRDRGLWTGFSKGRGGSDSILSPARFVVDSAPQPGITQRGMQPPFPFCFSFLRFPFPERRRGTTQDDTDEPQTCSERHVWTPSQVVQLLSDVCRWIRKRVVAVDWVDVADAGVQCRQSVLLPPPLVHGVGSFSSSCAVRQRSRCCQHGVSLASLWLLLVRLGRLIESAPYPGICFRCSCMYSVACMYPRMLSRQALLPSIWRGRPTTLRSLPCRSLRVNGDEPRETMVEWRRPLWTVAWDAGLNGRARGM